MITVTCAIIEHEGKVLAAQRGETMSQPLKWEFPGGKVEPEESLPACIVREIGEELGVRISVLEQLPQSVYDYGYRKVIMLIPFRCRLQSYDFALKEHQQIRWLEPQELLSLDWAPADIPIVQHYVRQNHP
jgi:8-oxo-dGTP diphosphatase